MSNNEKVKSIVNFYWETGIDVVNYEEISFQIRLKELIEEKGINIKKLSEDIGVTYSTAWNWFNTDIEIKRLRRKTLEKLSNYFDVDVGYLLCDQVEKREEKKTTSSLSESDFAKRQREIADKYYNGDFRKSFRHESPFFGTDSFVNLVNHSTDNTRIRTIEHTFNEYDTDKFIAYDDGVYVLIEERISILNGDYSFIVDIDGTEYALSDAEFKALKNQASTFAQFIIKQWAKGKDENQ